MRDNPCTKPFGTSFSREGKAELPPGVLGPLLCFCLFLCAAAFAQDAPPARTALPSPGYRLQLGDSFEVLYRFTPEYNQTATVLPDGSASLTLLGQVQVRGLTLAEVHDRIEVAAARRLNRPDLTVVLKDYERPHFTVLGEVANPGRYELRGPLSTVDGLALAGGFKTSARHTQVLLIHRVSETVGETQLLDFKALDKAHPGQELVALRDGDILIVPQSKFSKVERFVRLLNTGVYYNPVSR